LKSIWIVCAIACSVPQEPPTSTSVLEEPALETATEDTPEADAPLDPSSACGRAEVCCRAFAAAISDVVEASACSGPREASSTSDADARCERMSAGWRETLERLPSAPPPPECSPPDE